MGFVSDIIGGITGADQAANAAGKAADTQAAAVEKSNEYLRETRDLARQDQMPFLNAGNSGLNRLLYGLGLGGSQNGSTPASQMTAEQIRAQLLPQFTRVSNSGAANTAGGISAPPRGFQNAQVGWNPAINGQDWYIDTPNGGDQIGSTRQWANSNTQGFGNAQNANAQSGQTIDEAGLQAAINRQLQSQGAQNPQSGGPGYGNLLESYAEYQPLTAETFKTDPSYQWRLDQGNNALTRSLNAGGNLNSGRALKALTDYNQGAASQEYQAAYGRNLNDYQTGFNAFNTNQNNQYNRLMGLVGVGQGAGQQIANQGLQTGQALAGNAIQSGNAQAAGQVAQGQSGTTGFNSLLGIAGLGLGAYNAFGGNSTVPRQGVTSYGIRS